LCGFCKVLLFTVIFAYSSFGFPHTITLLSQKSATYQVSSTLLGILNGEESPHSLNPTTWKRHYILSNGRCSKWTPYFYVCVLFRTVH